MLAEIALGPDHPDAALAGEHAGRALAKAEELGMRPLAAYCHLGLGTLFRRTGDHAKTQEHLSTATAMYREMGIGFWLEKAEAGLGPPDRDHTLNKK